jgi:hypothetical protein
MASSLLSARGDSYSVAENPVLRALLHAQHNHHAPTGVSRGSQQDSVRLFPPSHDLSPFVVRDVRSMPPQSGFWCPDTQIH